MSQEILSRMLRKLDEAEGYLMLDMPERTLEILGSFDDWAVMQFEACLLQGLAWQMLERYREALRPLEAAAALSPDDVRVAVALGWCYKRTHRLAQAIDALTRAVRANPDEAILHYNLACYWSLLGDVEKSLTELEIALRLDPDFRAMLGAETDFDAIRANPRFSLLAAGKPATLA